MIRALILIACVACGPSGRDVALAKTARYRAPKLALFEIVRTTVGKKHEILQSDEMELTIATKGRWYTVEGLATNWRPPSPCNPNRRQTGGGAAEEIPRCDKALHISLTVRLMPEGRNWVVYIKPTIERFNVGMPNLEKVDPTAADVPGWATGKVDKLAYEIHKALRKYQVDDIDNSTPPPVQPDPNPAEPHPVDLPATNAGSDS